MNRYKCLFMTLFMCTNIPAMKFFHPTIDDGYATRSIWSIDKDKKDHVWFATTHNVLKYDGYQFKELNISEKIQYKKRTIHFDSANTLWIGTEYGEIFSYDHNNINIFDPIHKLDEIDLSNNQFQINKISSDINNNIYLATNNGLYTKDPSNNTIKLIAFKQQVLKDILISDTQQIYTIQNNHFLKITPSMGNYKTKKIFSFDKGETARVLHQTKDQEILIGTNDFLYQYNETSQSMRKIKTIESNIILSITSDTKRIWVGTLMNGIYSIDKNTNLVSNYQHDPNRRNSVSDNVIVSLLLDKSGVLFIGTFDGNISMLNTASINFHSFNRTQNSLACSKSDVIYHVYENEQKALWLSTANGLVHYSPKHNLCHWYGSNNQLNTLSYPEIRSINRDSKNQYWISTNNGLNVLDSTTGKIDRLTGQVPNLPTIFSLENKKDNLIIGTESGLFKYDIKLKKSEKFSATDKRILNAEFFAYQQILDGSIYFATSAGVAQISNGEINLLQQVNELIGNVEIRDIYIDETKNTMWISTTANGLYIIGDFDHIIYHYKRNKELPKNVQLLDILEDDNGYIWISSLNGLYRFNKKSKNFHIFFESDGLQSNTFKRGSSFKAHDGKLYFGGLRGFNGFYPSDISLNTKPPNIELTSLTRFNRKITVGIPDEDFIIDKPINKIETLHLNHKDFIFGLEFAALDYVDSMRNQYAYMLEGLDPDWNYTDAKNRKVTYTNLKAGLYSFKYKAANKDGIWNDNHKTLQIIVKPAPWLSWWAYLGYSLVASFLILYITNRRIKNEKKISKQLQEQVSLQTRHINQQNETLLSMIERKNELFTNVSHEFRTPLTLILGPVEELIKKTKIVGNISSLHMIKRNAKRLLSLVDQLLLLVKFTDKTPLIKKTQRILPAVKLIVATFEHSAHNKNIQIDLSGLHDQAINVTADALEIVISNLLSNAIKYTPEGGKISIGSNINKDTVQLYVQDTGLGIAKDQQEIIFDRFKRLEQDQAIEGIGIGLALVEEVAHINNSTVKVESTPGKGSKFSIEFTLVKEPIKIQEPSPETIVNLNHDLRTQSNSIKTDKVIINKETVLIIEDNQDMQTHISNILSENFNPILANNGEDGVKLAIKKIPDIIICDVMMPKMNGYEVCRKLRKNMITSHIPLILLTVLNEKSNRIKGWKENIDLYLTKPFDADELKLQLRNILNIRNLLNQKIHNKLVNNITPLNLPEMDAKFINKLKKTINKEFQNPLLNLARIASLIHVSERQLQRKTKALINLSPIDFLRDYRLEKSTKFLKDGYQVSITSDKCGFNSVTYFSSCFKAKYGLSPKNYQKQH